MIDIVDARKYKNRNEIQEFMKCIIMYLNKIFYKSLKKPLMFSAGDYYIRFSMKTLWFRTLNLKTN